MSETIIQTTEKDGTNRRQLLTRAGFLGAAVLGTNLLNFGKGAEADAALSTRYTPSQGKPFVVNDTDILNFALSLEYVGAEIYNRASSGVGLSSADTGLSSSNVNGGSKVPFSSPAVMQYAAENAADELGHVRALRATLGKKAVPEAQIDFIGAFTAIMIAAGVINTGETFNPFENEMNFLLSVYTLEDVEVTAYHGAAPYVKNSAYLKTASSILAVEAYHSAEIRTLIYQMGPDAITIANKISALRNTLSAAADPANSITDQGVTNSDGTANIVPADVNSIAFARTFGQVLNIVYGSANPVPVPGGLFPNGINGRIR